MGDPVTMAAVATATTGAMSGASAIMGGRAQASSARMKAAQRQIDAMAAETRAKQINTAAFEQLRSTLGNIDSLNAARGVAVNGGGTNAALFDEAMERSSRARLTASANARSEASRARTDSQILFDGADSYALAGLLKGATGFLEAASGLGRLAGGGGGGGGSPRIGPGSIY